MVFFVLMLLGIHWNSWICLFVVFNKLEIVWKLSKSIEGLNRFIQNNTREDEKRGIKNRWDKQKCRTTPVSDILYLSDNKSPKQIPKASFIYLHIQTPTNGIQKLFLRITSATFWFIQCWNQFCLSWWKRLFWFRSASDLAQLGRIWRKEHIRQKSAGKETWGA